MKIVIVDDNALIIQLLTRVCEEAGHSVRATDNGYDALDLFTADCPDAAFIDLIMPGLGGDILCRTLRRIPDFNDCRLILMSGAAAEAGIDLEHIGADHLLAKGATRTMIDNVRQMLEGLTRERGGDAADTTALGLEEVVQRRITKELLERGRHLKEVLNAVFNGVVEVSGGSIVYANTAAGYLLGRSPEELLNTELLSYFSADAHAALAPDSAADDGSGAPLPVVSLGRRRVRVKRVPAASTAGTGDLYLMVDVTDAQRLADDLVAAHRRLDIRVQERQRQLAKAHAQLTDEADRRLASLRQREAQESRFDQFMGVSPAAAFIKDADGRYLYVNDAFCRIFNVARDRAVGRRDRDVVGALSADQMEKNDRSVIRRKSALSTVEVVDRGDDRRYYVTTRFPMFTETDVLLGGVAMDITEEKRHVEERYDMQGQIHQLRKMEAIGVLAGEMAHELNNLLSGLVSYPDFLLTSGDALPPGFREKIDRIRLAGRRAAAMVTDVLQLAGGDMQKRVPLDLNRVVAECLAPGGDRPAVPGHIRLESRRHPAPVMVRGTEGLLCKVVRRLLDYGVAHIGKADGTIRFAVESVSLEAAFSSDYQTVPAGVYGAIVFSESGPSLSPADRAQFFEPFFIKERLGRIDSGLWMSVIWGIVKAHKGYIDMGTDAGGGNRMRILLPQLAGEAPSAAVPGSDNG